MARQRISEYRAKSLLFAHLGVPYAGIVVDATQDVSPQLRALDGNQRFVVKVDQGVKKRMKRGLIALHTSVEEIPQAIAEIKDKGFTQFIIEPMASYDAEYERYLAIDRQRDGYRIFFSPQGGIDIEEHGDTVKTVTLPYSGDRTELLEKIRGEIGLDPKDLEQILAVFDNNYFSFLEINPLILHGGTKGTMYHKGTMHIIDLAVEVDSVSDFFVQGAWAPKDYTFGEKKAKTPEEKVIDELKNNSQAAFTLDVLNENGSIFMLLSGGGASLVLADEVANLGLGKELANYGEYSGNPNQEETYLYTKEVLSLLLRSQAPKKVLIIGGGVANFTDIRITFKGVIKALDEKKAELNEQQVKIFVRRGGPNQKEGLRDMKEFLEKEKLLGRVVGPEILLTEIVQDAIQSIS